MKIPFFTKRKEEKMRQERERKEREVLRAAEIVAAYKDHVHTLQEPAAHQRSNRASSNLLSS